MNLRLKKNLRSATFKSFKFYTDLFTVFQSAAGVIQPLAGLRKALSHDAPADKTIRVQDVRERGFKTDSKSIIRHQTAADSSHK